MQNPQGLNALRAFITAERRRQVSQIVDTQVKAASPIRPTATISQMLDRRCGRRGFGATAITTNPIAPIHAQKIGPQGSWVVPSGWL